MRHEQKTNDTDLETVQGEVRVILLACKGLPRPTGSICDRCPSPGQLGTTGERKRQGETMSAGTRKGSSLPGMCE